MPLSEAIGDLAGRLNTRYGLAQLETALNNILAACRYYQQLFAIADMHPFFREHLVVKSWREEYARLSYEAKRQGAISSARRISELETDWPPG